MEAKVDIRKLQLLNDRIAQTIDALNQVRLSVHGLQQSAQAPGLGMPFGAFGQGAWGQGPFAQQGMFGGMQGTVPGVSHTPGVFNPLMAPALQQQNPLVSQLWGAGINPFAAMQQQGIGHTGVETIDPYGVYAGRIGQTFPFVQWGASPFVQGYSPYGSGMF